MSTIVNENLVNELDHADPQVRLKALEELAASESLPELKTLNNMHGHTIYSYNPYGFTPSRWAWEARQLGLELAGKVEFDVLDGMEEFFAAGKILGLKTAVSVESRVFVPEFADREINSPGEPGISYHMGIGFTEWPTDESAKAFLKNMGASATQRNRDLLDRVNPYLDPVTLDYDKDVIPVTPSGNATERHLCACFADKAAKHFTLPEEAGDFWAEKLGIDRNDIHMSDGGALQAAIRAKTMKRGGVGYVQPGKESFPLMADMNAFSLACNAIPTFTWLNGLSTGEQSMDELMDVAASTGTAAINIIPDRNFTEGVKDEKLEKLYDVVEKANARHWPVIVGTELNSPGNKLVDDFHTAELQPLVPTFMKGAYILYAHTVLQRHAGKGYLSDWAGSAFADVAAKNEFYEAVGRAVDPRHEEAFASAAGQDTPKAILTATT